jgi:hypothetical protein
MLFFIIGYSPDCFPHNRTTVDTYKEDDVEITFIENNYCYDVKLNKFEATFVFLIRQNGVLTTVEDRHTLGLFDKSIWVKHFKYAGFNNVIEECKEIEEIEQKGSYSVIGFKK